MLCTACGSPVNGRFCGDCGAPAPTGGVATLTVEAPELPEQRVPSDAYVTDADSADVTATPGQFFRSRRGAVVIGAVALAVAGAGLGVALASSPSTVTLHGGMAIMPASDSYEFGENFSVTGKSCEGTGGYSDLAPGASVTIHDASGKVIATGTLGKGVGASGIGCILQWRISNVPKSNFYGVEISHRGTVTFSSKRVKQGFDTSIGQ